MFRTLACCIPLLLLAGIAQAQEASDDKDKLLSGMSIVGNDEAPKSLVIVPWKSSDLGNALSVSRILDNGPQPVDRDVFKRELAYYRIWAQSQETRSADRK
jgi:hypothetical protein